MDGRTPTSPPTRLSGVEAMRAVAHPTRIRMLELLRHEPLSASELARRLGIRFGSARFHLQKLVHVGMAQPAGERRVRGGRELLFSAPGDVSVDIDPAHPMATAALHRALTGELDRRLQAAATDQRPGDSDLDIVSLRQVRLTTSNRRRAEHIAAEALGRIRALGTADPHGQADGEAHDELDGGTEPVTLGLFLFRTPEAIDAG